MEKERERETGFTCWFTFQMLAMLGKDLGLGTAARNIIQVSNLSGRDPPA